MGSTIYIKLTLLVLDSSISSNRSGSLKRDVSKQYLISDSNLGQDSAFVNVYKGSLTAVKVNAENGEVLCDVKCKPDQLINKLENRVQFRVAAVNIIGQSEWSSPFAIRLPGNEARAGR